MSIPLLDPELLKAFVAVADSRSFTRAASQLNRTQSAVSMQIKRLEERLGVELFNRTKANVDLSSAGEGLLGYARRILTLNDEAVGKLRERKIEGVVRLGVMDDYGTLIVPPLLASFVACYPLVQVEMETGLTSSMPSRLGNAYDLVIAMHPEGSGEGEFLRREQAAWATGAFHPVEQQNPLPLALYPQGCLFRKWAIEALDAVEATVAVGFRQPKPCSRRGGCGAGACGDRRKGRYISAEAAPLSERDGMPRLPAADICLHRTANLPQAGALLANHLRSTISNHLDEISVRRATRDAIPIAFN